MMRFAAASLALLVLSCSHAGAQSRQVMLTAPERTSFAETTRYADVIRFMEAADAASPLITLRTFGYTYEGRPLPLAVVTNLSDSSPAAIRASGRTVVYLQGDIHAGEVEGKEVLLMLLRDVAEGRQSALLDSLVLLVGPILNADGNERVTLTNRGPQHGPIAGMGTRPNAQGLNINRDHMKLDSPEGRSFVLMLREYDPHVTVDLHTTNGTFHAYHLTYSPPLHPNTDPAILGILRNGLFPEMTSAARDQLGWDFYYYGNVQGEGDERGWYTFDYRALFNNNYVGLRNRLGILSEAYSYATFEERIRATRLFVDETLRFAHQNAGRIREITAAADRESLIGQTLTLRAAPERSPAPVDILLGGVTEEPNPFTGEMMYRRTSERRAERMWEYGTFAPTAIERVPSAYIVPAALTRVLENLAAHGVRSTPYAPVAGETLESFAISAQQVAPREFEGRIERTIEGAWATHSGPAPTAAVRISLDQPLGRLIFSLLEPRSADGLASWGTLGEALEGAGEYPILRVTEGLVTGYRLPFTGERIRQGEVGAITAIHGDRQRPRPNPPRTTDSRIADSR